MMEIQRSQKRHPGLKIAFPISAVGSQLTVGDGKYMVNDQEYSLTEPFTYSLEANDLEQTLVIHLVRKKDTGASLIMVDAVLHGEIPYTFREDDEQFIHVYNIADVSVPAGATDFKNSKCRAYQELGPEEKTNG